MKHLIALALLLGSTQSLAVTIDFEDVDYISQPPGDAPVVIATKGFEFTTYHSLMTIGNGLTGKDYTVCTTQQWPCDPAGAPYGADVSFWQASGDLFSLQSMDIAVSDDSCVVFRGYDTGVDLADSIPPGFVGCEDFESGIFLAAGSHNITFGAEWAGLSEVYIHTHSEGLAMSVDNIVVSVVPIPAAVWLFASGLGFLGLFRRSKS